MLECSSILHPEHRAFDDLCADLDRACDGSRRSAWALDGFRAGLARVLDGVLADRSGALVVLEDGAQVRLRLVCRGRRIALDLAAVVRISARKEAFRHARAHGERE